MKIFFKNRIEKIPLPSFTFRSLNLPIGECVWQLLKIKCQWFTIHSRALFNNVLYKTFAFNDTIRLKMLFAIWNQSFEFNYRCILSNLDFGWCCVQFCFVCQTTFMITGHKQIVACSIFFSLRHRLQQYHFDEKGRCENQKKVLI